VRKVLDDTGLACHSTHNNAPSFTAGGLKKAIELNQIFDAVETKGGVEYYLIEQETGNDNGAELPMVKRCLDNWKKLRVA
jgi:hypothetical protein